MFVQDTTLARMVKIQAENKLLQKYHFKIADWMSIWRRIFNVNICKLMYIWIFGGRTILSSSI